MNGAFISAMIGMMVGGGICAFGVVLGLALHNVIKEREENGD